MSPEVAQKIPPDLSITLSEIGSGDMLAPIVKAIDTVAVLAWTVPLAAVVLLVAAVFVSPIRRRGVPPRRRCRPSSRPVWSAS